MKTYLNDKRVLIRFSKEVYKLYIDKQVPKSAAAMSYHLTMTFFPLIICLYFLFGQNYSTAVKILDYVRHFLTEDAAKMIETYLGYLASESGTAITLIAVTTMIASASAAMRVMMRTINDIQDGSRFNPVIRYLFSFVMAVGLLIAFYFAFIVLLTGDSFLDLIRPSVPQLEKISDWTWARFLALGGLALLALWFMFRFLRPKGEKFRVMPGALFSTFGIVIMNVFFSGVIAASAKYQIIYGSLATLVLLMIWIYFSCQMILVGECINTALREWK